MEHSETKNNNGLFLYSLFSTGIKFFIYPCAFFSGLYFLTGHSLTGLFFLILAILIMLKSRAMKFNFKRQSGHVIYNGDNGF